MNSAVMHQTRKQHICTIMLAWAFMINKQARTQLNAPASAPAPTAASTCGSGIDVRPSPSRDLPAQRNALLQFWSAVSPSIPLQRQAIRLAERICICVCKCVMIEHVLIWRSPSHCKLPAEGDLIGIEPIGCCPVLLLRTSEEDFMIHEHHQTPGHLSCMNLLESRKPWDMNPETNVQIRVQQSSNCKGCNPNA